MRVDPDALAETAGRGVRVDLDAIDYEQRAADVRVILDLVGAFLEAPTGWYCYTHEVATSDGLYETEFGSHEYDGCTVGRVRLVPERSEV